MGGVVEGPRIGTRNVCKSGAKINKGRNGVIVSGPTRRNWAYVVPTFVARITSQIDIEREDGPTPAWGLIVADLYFCAKGKNRKLCAPALPSQRPLHRCCVTQ